MGFIGRRLSRSGRQPVVATPPDDVAPPSEFEMRRRAPRRMADVHFRPGGDVFVFTYSRNADGAWIVDGLPTVLQPAFGVEELGHAVLRALNSSTSGVLPSRNLREDPPDRELLAWLGLPSYAAYARGVRSVGVSWFIRESIDILVTPSDNLGRGRGFVPLREQAETVDETTPDAIGHAVLRAREHARV